MPLHLLIDSTGIKAEGEGKWNARKHVVPKRRLWRKIHIGIDEQTLEVRAIEVTGSNVGDAPILPDLLNQITPDQEIGSVTADGAYDTRKCHNAIAARDTQAVIPPRKNAKLWKPDTAGRLPRTKRCNPQTTSVEPFGEDGRGIIAGAASKRRCIVSNCWVSALPQASSIGR